MRVNKTVLAGIFILAGIFAFTAMPSTASWFSTDTANPEATEAMKNQPFTFGTFRDIAKSQSSTVVNISTSTIIKRRYPTFNHQWHSPFDDLFGDDFFRYFFRNPPSDQKVQSLGSGVIIDDEGYILTNHHVAEDVDVIKVTTLDGKTYDAEIVGSDAQTDIALLRIEPTKPLNAIKLGNSDGLEVGDWVMAIGNPFGFGHTVTVGVVSAKGRSLGNLLDELPYQDFIQTDASINPGNSGGPLLDIHGKLVGINSVIASKTGQSAGIGFAIPINMIVPLINQLKEKGTVTRGWLGVTIQPLDENLAENFGLDSIEGALVSEILEGSPADKAGIKVQDIIVKLNGTKVRDSAHLSRIVAASPVGEKVKVEIIRDGKSKMLHVKLGQRPDDLHEVTVKNETVSNLGMSVQTISPEIARQLNLDETDGVIITDVEPESAADRAGLRRGDIILEFNQKKIKSVNDYSDAINRLKPGDGAVMYVKRGDSKLFLAIKAPKE